MRAQAWARTATMAVLCAGMACTETQRSLGEDCLKDDDCLSGICADGRCAAAPPLLDAEPPDVTPDGPVDSSPDVQSDGSGTDAVNDTAPDTAADAPEGGSTDSSADAGSG